jgi:asparagine synthase (glutamine-hydrolysing)
MPGLAGFVCHRDPPQCAGALDRMVASISHGPFVRTVHRVTTEGLAAAQVHTGIPSYPDPVAPRPAGSTDVNVWLDGTLHALDTPSGRRPISAGDDPAMILAGLYGADPDFGFLPGLDGIFAAVVHDPERRLLHLITDRYGLRQLYWSRTPGGIAWSSELKAFTHLPGFSPVIDRLAVRQFFEVGYLLEDTSWFEGVELVPSGSVLTCNLGDGRRWPTSMISRTNSAACSGRRSHCGRTVSTVSP